jgi:hypothetical protein
MPELITMAYINYWFKHVFESLGWMILSMKQGNKNKVIVYFESLNHLYENNPFFHLFPEKTLKSEFI